MASMPFRILNLSLNTEVYLHDLKVCDGGYRYVAEILIYRINGF